MIRTLVRAFTVKARMQHKWPIFSKFRAAKLGSTVHARGFLQAHFGDPALHN
jgi:hypothetical protein